MPVVRRLMAFSIAVLFAAAIPAPAEVLQTASSGTSTKTSASTVTVTDQDNGKDIDLAPDQTLIVKLASTPATGYRWTVEGDPSPLKLQKQTYRKNTKSSAMGAPGMEIFQFSAGSSGIANLKLNYHRSWEYNVPPVKTFAVRVNVR
jgi:inhibitor of cysteine peptidase